MTILKISIPVYKRSSWGAFSEQGTIEVSTAADSDTLSDSYEGLKLQIEDLLLKMQAESLIVTDLQQLYSEIDRRQGTLRDLNEKIDAAKTQWQRLEKFLRRLGIDPTSYSLDISNHVLESAIDEPEEAVAVEAEVDPIPFDPLVDIAENREMYYQLYGTEPEDDDD